MPSRRARAPVASARSREFAATPPQITSAGIRACAGRADRSRVSASQTASWNEAHRSASACPAGMPCSRTWCSTAVFRPLKEKSKLRARAPRQSARELDRPRSPASRQLSMCAPARVRQPEQLRHLVERLARGVVERVAQQRGSRRAPAPRRARCARPRPPARARAARGASLRQQRRRAGAPRGGSRRPAACRSPRRATFPPARRPAARRPAPGPRSRRCRPRRAARSRPSRSASSSTGRTRCRWSREASSGTTPPHFSCTSICVCTTSARTRPRRPSSVVHHRGGGLVAAGLQAEDAHRAQV